MFRKIEISKQTILFAIAVLAGIWLVVQIKDILFLLFIAFLLMTAIYPIVVFLERFRVPKGVAILLVYVVVLGFFGVVIASSIPAIVTQTTRLVEELPGVVEKVLPYWNIDIRTATDQIAPLSENLLRVTVNIFTNIITTVTVLVFTFYFILERSHAHTIFSDLFGEIWGLEATTVLRLIERRLGAWVRSELFLMSLVGVLTYIGLTILKIDFALPLAILAGVLEIVPMIGPNVAAVPGILIGLSISPMTALTVAIMYIIIQQLENNIFVPFIMKRNIGLSPIVTILALMIGGRLGGIVGAVLGVPTVLVIEVLANRFLNTKNPSR